MVYTKLFSNLSLNSNYGQTAIINQTFSAKLKRHRIALNFIKNEDRHI